MESTTESPPTKRTKLAHGVYSFKVKFGANEFPMYFPPVESSRFPLTTGGLREYIEEQLSIHNAKITKLVKSKAVQKSKPTDNIPLSSIKIKKNHKIHVVGSKRSDVVQTLQKLSENRVGLKEQQDRIVQDMRRKRGLDRIHDLYYGHHIFESLDTFAVVDLRGSQSVEVNAFESKLIMLQTLSGQLRSLAGHPTPPQPFFDVLCMDYARTWLDLLNIHRLVKVSEEALSRAGRLMQGDCGPIVMNYRIFPKIITEIVKTVTDDTIERNFELKGHSNLFERSYGVLTTILAFWSRKYLESTTGLFLARDVRNNICEFVGNPAGLYFSSLYDSHDYDEEGNITGTHTLDVQSDGTFRYFTSNGSVNVLVSRGTLSTRLASYSVQTESSNPMIHHLGMIEERVENNAIDMHSSGFYWADLFCHKLRGFQPYPFYKSRMQRLLEEHDPSALAMLDENLVRCIFENAEMDVDSEEGFQMPDMEPQLWEEYRRMCGVFKRRCLPRISEYARRIITFHAYLDEVFCEIEGSDRRYVCARYSHLKH